jgi:FMN-dependent oxidoreductase (nitrilotriacetate monooxygenase family)
MAERAIHLNFHGNSSGEHLAAWRKPSADSPAEFAIDYYLEIARIAERGLFDAVFFAAGLALPDDGRPVRPVIDPIVLISALSSLTKNIGFVATASTTFNEPYNIARTFSSLDHITGGRTGWNIVTTYDELASRNFGQKNLPDRADRYARAEEFVTVVNRLWHSWEEAAVVSKPDGTVDIDGSHIHAIRHEGNFFSVAGPLQTPRSKQGKPVLFQAGGSGAGQALAARHADAIFSIGLELGDAQAFYKGVKALVAQEGRDPETLHILPGVYLYLGATHEEAERKRRALIEDPRAVAGYVKQLATRLGVATEALELDKTVPESILADAVSKAGSVGHTQALVALLRKEKLTLREFIHRQPVGGPHRVIVGTPEQVADTLEEWFSSRAADGFNIGNMPPADLADFVDQVIPVLQKRGIYRKEYSGTTLRDHYGLA